MVSLKGYHFYVYCFLNQIYDITVGTNTVNMSATKINPKSKLLFFIINENTDINNPQITNINPPSR